VGRLECRSGAAQGVSTGTLVLPAGKKTDGIPAAGGRGNCKERSRARERVSNKSWVLAGSRRPEGPGANEGEELNGGKEGKAAPQTSRNFNMLHGPKRNVTN